MHLASTLVIGKNLSFNPREGREMHLEAIAFRNGYKFQSP